MAEQESPTWGSMIWGATKIVGLVAATALVLPPAMTFLGGAIAGIGGETATSIGTALGTGGEKLAGLTSSVAGIVVKDVALPTTFQGLGELATTAGTAAWDATKNAADYVVKNPGQVAGIAGTGLAVGYMLRGAERPAPRPQRVSAAPAATGRFVEAEMARRQMAALAAQKGLA